MQIAIIGYGKMGRAIEKLAHQRGHQIPLIVDENNISSLSKFEGTIDVAIEFTTPGTAAGNIRLCADLGIPVVVGTTGWANELEEVKHYVSKKSGTLFYASNFSLGVNIFFKLNEWLASVMNNYPAYQPSLDETHHIHKLDKPSGTAITLAEGLLNQHQQYDDWTLDTTDQKSKLPIISHRKGEVPGTHSVSYNSEMDELFIQHTAHSRGGFALGAMLVAEWLPGKKGVLTMNDFLKF